MRLIAICEALYHLSMRTQGKRQAEVDFIVSRRKAVQYLTRPQIARHSLTRKRHSES